VFEKHRVRFVFGRGLMRHLLASYAGCQPQTLCFVTGDAGKPAFDPSHPFAASLSFNLAHSDNRGLLAVGRGQALGVDLEQQNDRTRGIDIADGYFHGSELQSIRAAQVNAAQQLFFRFWTAKEAVLKAEGTGLSTPLDAFRIVFRSDGASADVESLDPQRVSPHWFVRMLPCDAGWSAAVAASGQDWQVEVMGQA
jgi:4'-phosphopantetheinyl transferase